MARDSAARVDAEGSADRGADAADPVARAAAVATSFSVAAGAVRTRTTRSRIIHSADRRSMPSRTNSIQARRRNSGRTRDRASASRWVVRFESPAYTRVTVAGLPFDGNLIPASLLNPGSIDLLRFIPMPNLEGTDRNFHYVTTNVSSADSLSLRVTHSFTQNAGRGGPGGRGGGGGGRGGFGGPGGRGRGQQQRTSVNMTAQLQYRRNLNDQNNVFPTLSGEGTGSAFTLPVSVNIQHRRSMHNVNLNYSRTESQTRNQYAYVEDVAGNAGITGVATDPFDWGVPQLSFSTFTGVRDVTPSRRTDRRFSLGYQWTRPTGTKHTMHIGGDLRFDESDNQTDANARGAFVFTGLYSSGGRTTVRGGALDFADFLLGLPQQASVQYGPGNVRMSGKSLSGYWQDDWRWNSRLTLNLGLRYELIWPYYEQSGQMVNLDVTPDFTAAVPVISGESGPFTGSFPKQLMDADTNNLAPRIGFAWRIKPGEILRGGYGISYNSGSYASIARQLSGQAPFAVTNNNIGTFVTPLTIEDPFAGVPSGETMNNYGVDKNYALGRVQTVNADFSKDLRQVWSVGAGYTETHGAHLDIVRAPNRGPDGLRIADVQPFLWQTSEGDSILHAATFRLSRRPAKGIGGGVTYTLAKSRDDASNIGGGGATVAQDDQNLAAEWALSSFDRRHQLSANGNIELPFGPNRKWANQPGVWQSMLRDWRVATTFTWQSGTPFTPRVTAAVSDVARGTNGTLRANYRNGADISVRPVLARRAHGRQSRADDPGEHEQPAEHGELRRHRHRGQFADVRAGAVGTGDEVDAIELEVQVLVIGDSHCHAATTSSFLFSPVCV
jgi:hypothetical protein